MQERTVVAEGRATSMLDTGGDGPVVVIHDGYGSRLVARLAADAAEQLRIRLVAPDRPGFWASDATSGDPLDVWPDLLAAVLDQLGITTCSVLGASAGTPFALAFAARQPARVHRCAIAGPFGPLADAGDLSDMLASQRRSFAVAARWPRAGTAAMVVMGKVARRRPELLLRVLASQRPLADAERMRRPEMREQMLPLVAELFGDGSAARSELRAIVGDWTGLARKVEQPTRIWVGTDDTVHPRSMASALTTSIEHAEVTAVQGGFFALTDQISDVLTWCTEPGQR